MGLTEEQPSGPMLTALLSESDWVINYMILRELTVCVGDLCNDCHNCARRAFPNMTRVQVVESLFLATYWIVFVFLHKDFTIRLTVLTLWTKARGGGLEGRYQDRLSRELDIKQLVTRHYETTTIVKLLLGCLNLKQTTKLHHIILIFVPLQTRLDKLRSRDWRSDQHGGYQGQETYQVRGQDNWSEMQRIHSRCLCGLECVQARLWRSSWEGT